jgi:hypothetical protein
VRARSAELPALNCESCGALTPASKFRNFGDRLVCQACEHQNPQSRVRMVSREWLMPRAILLNFIPRDGYSVQAMHPDCRTMLGPLREGAECRDAIPPTSLSRSTTSAIGGIR